MRNVAVCGKRAAEVAADRNSVATIDVMGTPVCCGLVRTPSKPFTDHRMANRHRVLVKVKAFSCNYRDLAFLRFAAARVGDGAFWILGSEFSGEVLDVGSDVKSLRVGDRVIGDNHYSGACTNGMPSQQGIPTNNASQEYGIFNETSLMKIPASMPDKFAAAFSVGGQTSYSIIRKLGVRSGANVLVTAARSNTSMFVMNALKRYGVNTYAASRSSRAGDIGGFDYFIDPFCDVYLGQAVHLLRAEGKYITCGVAQQGARVMAETIAAADEKLISVMTSTIVNNVQIIGNCLGRTEDLVRALYDYANGTFHVLVDSVFSGDDVGRFLERTYNDPDRFGKVVYEYQ